MIKLRIVALLAASFLLVTGCTPRQGVPRSDSQFSQTSGEEEPSSSQSQESSQSQTSESDSSSSSESKPVSQSQAESTDKWNLMLVSAKYPLKAEVDFEFAEVGQIKVDKRIADSLKDMLAAAKKDGHALNVISGHRTFSRSKTLYETKVKEYKNSGYGEQEALAAAAKWVAPPGTSEHNTGLAVDIITSDYYTKLPDLLPEFEEFAEAQWMKEHAHEFGFILRYPKNKEKITGINFEPWHFRYVGEAAAKEIYEKDITLEEYLGKA